MEPLNKQEPTKGQREEPQPPTVVEKLLESPHIQEAISQIPSLIKASIEAKTGTTRGTAKGVLIWAAILVLLIVVPVFFLTWHNRLSSDAAAFLFGAIVGAAFTFLRNVFPKSD